MRKGSRAVLILGDGRVGEGPEGGRWLYVICSRAGAAPGVHIGSHEMSRDPAGVDLGQRGYNRLTMAGQQQQSYRREGTCTCTCTCTCAYKRTAEKVALSSEPSSTRLRCIWLQARTDGVAASTTSGCSLEHVGLQPQGLEMVGDSRRTVVPRVHRSASKPTSGTPATVCCNDVVTLTRPVAANTWVRASVRQAAMCRRWRPMSVCKGLHPAPGRSP